MQLNNTSGDAETLFEQYIHKTFKKTASLMAYSCQAVKPYLINSLTCHDLYMYLR